MTTIIRDDGNVTVTLLEDAGYPLGFTAGSVSLDEGGAPYCVADIRVPLPADSALLNLLDPREHRRIEIEVAQERIDGFPITTTRTFTVGLRTAAIEEDDATLALTLASDEALVMDDVLLSDTPNMDALDHQDSIRDIVDMVLDRVGAALEPGSPDFPFMVYTDATNLILNPRVATAATGWANAPFGVGTREGSGGPADAPTYYRVSHGTEATAPQLVTVARTGTRVQAETEYIQSVYVRASVATTVYTDALVFNGADIEIQDGPNNPVALAANTWTRISSTWTAPEDAATAEVRVVTTTTLPAGSTLDVTGFRLSKTQTGMPNTEYFDGGTTDTAEYAYSWSDVADASPSLRVALIDRNPEALIWEPGRSGWAFITPIIQSAGLRLFCNEAGEWWLVDGASYVAPGTTQLTQGAHLLRASTTISRDGDWHDAALVLYRWRAEDGSQAERIDWFAAPGYTRARTFIIEAPYPGPGRAEYKVKRAQGLGRTGIVESHLDLSVTPSQALRLTLPDLPELAGVTRSVEFDLTTFTNRIESRGLTDAPAGSWALVNPALVWDDVDPALTWAEADADSMIFD